MIKTKANIQFLLESCKIALLGLSESKFLNLTKDSEINGKNVIHLADFHGLNPILNAALKQSDLKEPIFEHLNLFARNNAVSNLISSQEFLRVSKLLDQNEVNFLPYKGHLFLNELYSGKQLREIGDFDILVNQVSVQKALNVLIEDGYCFHDVDKALNISNTNLIEIIPKTFGMNETTLTKEVKNKKSFIDFHWSFHYSFLPYKINIDKLFENKSKILINKQECVTPSDEAIFIMLIIHHGGRDIWMKLKYMADLLAFMETKGDKINWVNMLVTMTEMKLKRPMLVGFFLLKQYFEYQIPSEIESEFKNENINIKITEPLIDYWENCYDILSLKGRVKYERILMSIQDKGFSKKTYFKELFKMYSIPNPIESPRLVTFPKKYYFLNFVSKFITYVYKRGVGKTK